MPATLEPIFTQVVGLGGAQSIYFKNIPQNFSDLKVVCSVRSATTGGFDSFSMYLNSVQANISNTFLTGNGSSVSSSRSTYRALGSLNSAFNVSNTFTNLEIYIPNYNSLSFKQIIFDSVTESTQSESYQNITAELWSQNAPITQLHFDTSTSGQPFAQYSTFTLYGIRRLGA